VCVCVCNFEQKKLLEKDQNDMRIDENKSKPYVLHHTTGLNMKKVYNSGSVIERLIDSFDFVQFFVKALQETN